MGCGTKKSGERATAALSTLKDSCVFVRLLFCVAGLLGLCSPALGGTLILAAGQDLQAALDQALPGDTIELAAGATFTGNFTLPNKGDARWIYIRSSASAQMPSGVRVSPAQASLMPRIVSPNLLPALNTATGAHHYHFIGIEITTTHNVTTSTHHGLIVLQAQPRQIALSQVPTDITFDRSYIHGTPNGNVRRGIILNSARTNIIDSYLSDFHELGADSQAIAGWNGPGPFKIINNYIEGAGENVMFGGADPTIVNLVPSDIEIRHNHFAKPLSWNVRDPSYTGQAWTVKNLLELKNARRVLITENIFEYNWVHAQNGFAILFTVRNQDGTAPWAVVEDVAFTRNIVRHTANGLTVTGRDNLHPSEPAGRITIKDNLFEDVGGLNWGGGGRLFQILAGTADVTIENNTAFHTGNVITAEGAANTAFVYRNNITPHNRYGVIGTGTGVGISTLNSYFPGAIFFNNVLYGGPAARYPPHNYFPGSLAEVGFVNVADRDYRLASSTPYNSAGVDIAALRAATAGVVSGISSTPSQAPMQRQGRGSIR
jgi:hypothetical protein